jgi:hypothetical protein
MRLILLPAGLSNQVRHFLPTGWAEPVNSRLANVAQKVAVATRAIAHGIPTPNIAGNDDNVHGSHITRYTLLFLRKFSISQGRDGKSWNVSMALRLQFCSAVVELWLKFPF